MTDLVYGNRSDAGILAAPPAKHEDYSIRMARCVDCGFLAERRTRDGAIVQPTEHHREQLALRDRLVDPTLRCYVEFDGFDAARVRETIECPLYVRRLPDRTLWEHLEMQQILEARREAQEARDEARHSAKKRANRERVERWTIAVLTLVGIVLAALIGRGIIWGPVG